MSVLRNIAASLPKFTDDPADRLRHTNAAHRDTAIPGFAVTATAGGIYPGHDRTGLTYGDLRALEDRVIAADARERLARHLYATYGAISDRFPWDTVDDEGKQAWLARADELLAVAAGREE